MSLDPTKQYFTKYTDSRLGSGFTEENSANTVTSVIGDGFSTSSVTETMKEDERITAAALSDLEHNDIRLINDSINTINGNITTINNNKCDKTAVISQKLTGYAIAGSKANVAATDTILQAIAKLEKRINLLENA